MEEQDNEAKVEDETMVEENAEEVKEEEGHKNGKQTDSSKETKRISSLSAKEDERASVGSTIKEKHDGENNDVELRKRSFSNEKQKTKGDHIKHEQVEGEDCSGDNVEGEQHKNEQVEGEQVADELVEGEQGKRDEIVGEHLEEDQLVGEIGENEMEEEGMTGEHNNMAGELRQEEHAAEEDLEESKLEEIAKKSDEDMIEEEGYIEEPPPDPAAPYNFCDSKEALKEPFELRPDQISELEQLWAMYQNYTPTYTDINGYITVKELCYMLKCLLIYPFTEEQLFELIDFAVRPPHPDGHISFEQFVRIVKLRQRNFPQEEELRLALQVFDQEKSGILNRDNLKDVLLNKGHKISEKIVMNLVKEVDLTNDGTLGVEDIVGTMAIDMNRDDIILMQSTLNTLQEQLEGILGVAIRRNDEDEDGEND